MPEWTKLAGVAVIVVGLALKQRPTLVVVVAAFATGLVSGLPIFSRPDQEGVVDMLGRGFADNRLITLFLITLPVIGLAERYGLQEQSSKLIGRFRAATAGRLLLVYQLFRVLHGIMGIRLNGHPIFVRPLIFPMAAGCLRDGASEQDLEKIKAATSASENYGNFYGQNLSPALPGVLLVYSVLKELGCQASILRIVLFAIPVTAISVILAAVQFHLLDRQLRRRGAK